MSLDGVRAALPTQWQQQLLQVLLAPDAQAQTAWRQLEPTFDLDRLDPSAFHVMPMLHARLQQLAVTSATAAALQPRLAGLRRHTWYRGELAARRTCELLCTLEQHGVLALLVDGPVLAARLYPEAGLRTPGEPVVLVRRQDRARALQILSGSGWQPQHRTARLRALVRMQRLEDPDGFVVQIGLEQPNLMPGMLESVWLNAERVLLHDREHAVPSLPHLLLLLLQAHHRAAQDRRCVWPADAARVLTHPSFDDGYFAELCRELQPNWVAEPLAFLEHRLGVPVPARARQSTFQRRLLGTAGEGSR